jgi:hypothetical protein
LPTEYGGQAGTIPDILKKLETRLVEDRDYFLQESSYGTDEKKRKGKPKNTESLFGFEGSFRKLELD